MNGNKGQFDVVGTLTNNWRMRRPLLEGAKLFRGSPQPEAIDRRYAGTMMTSLLSSVAADDAGALAGKSDQAMYGFISVFSLDDLRNDVFAFPKDGYRRSLSDQPGDSIRIVQIEEAFQAVVAELVDAQDRGSADQAASIARRIETDILEQCHEVPLPANHGRMDAVAVQQLFLINTKVWQQGAKTPAALAECCFMVSDVNARRVADVAIDNAVGWVIPMAERASTSEAVLRKYPDIASDILRAREARAFAAQRFIGKHRSLLSAVVERAWSFQSMLTRPERVLLENLQQTEFAVALMTAQAQSVRTVDVGAETACQTAVLAQEHGGADPAEALLPRKSAVERPSVESGRVEALAPGRDQSIGQSRQRDAILQPTTRQATVRQAIERLLGELRVTAATLDAKFGHVNTRTDVPVR